MKRIHVIIIMSIWSILILGLILWKQWTLWTGTEVLLHTRPVDPRDLFRGQYVTLSYDISTTNAILGNPLSPTNYENTPWHPGDQVYVTLQTDESQIAHAQAITKTKPPKGTLFLKGTIMGWGQQIEYGIESYFIPEKKGKEIESQRGKNLYVRVSIDGSGTAVIRDIELR